MGDSAFLPAWGEFTQKDNHLYLIVTHWPKDGKLEVPLLQNPIQQVALLTDPARQSLAYEKAKDPNGNDRLVIHVPANAPSTVASVIAVTCAGERLQLAPFQHGYDAAKKQIHLAAANFQAYAANVKSLSLYYDGAQQAIVNWRYGKGGSPTVAWTFDAPEAGEYNLEMD